MIWKVDESNPRSEYNRGRHVQVPSAAMKHYYEWRNLIVQNNWDPKKAAEHAGDMWYKKLQGGSGLYEIRLSQAHRVFFRVDWTSCTVTITKIGGHA